MRVPCALLSFTIICQQMMIDECHTMWINSARSNASAQEGRQGRTWPASVGNLSSAVSSRNMTCPENYAENCAKYCLFLAQIASVHDNCNYQHDTLRSSKTSFEERLVAAKLAPSVSIRMWVGCYGAKLMSSRRQYVTEPLDMVNQKKRWSLEGMKASVLLGG